MNIFYIRYGLFSYKKFITHRGMKSPFVKTLGKSILSVRLPTRGCGAYTSKTTTSIIIIIKKNFLTRNASKPSYKKMVTSGYNSFDLVPLSAINSITYNFFFFN